MKDADVFLIEYCGYPHTTGSPSESGYYASANAAFEEVTSKGYQKIVLVGASLGCAMALYVAHKHNSDSRIIATILLAPFESVARCLNATNALLAKLPFVPQLIDVFKNYKHIRNVSNCYIVHDKQDRLAPIRNARNLKKANPSVVLVETDGLDHDTDALFRALAKECRGLEGFVSYSLSTILSYLNGVGAGNVVTL